MPSFPKFYIASGLNNAAQAMAMRDILVMRGWTQTYDWTEHGSVNDSPELYQPTAEKELRGVADADVVIVLLPGGRGTHFEMGAACALKKPVLLFAENKETMLLGGLTCVFYYLPNVKQALDEKFLSLDIWDFEKKFQAAN